MDKIDLLMKQKRQETSAKEKKYRPSHLAITHDVILCSNTANVSTIFGATSFAMHFSSYFSVNRIVNCKLYTILAKKKPIGQCMIEKLEITQIQHESTKSIEMAIFQMILCFYFNAFNEYIF